MNIWKKAPIAARLAVFAAILLGALSSAIVAPTPAQADKGEEEPTLILLFGAEESLLEAGDVISQQIDAVELLRSYPKEYLQEFPNGEESEAGRLYHVVGDASSDEVVKQIKTIIERHRIQDVAIEAENLAPLFYVPGQVLLTGPEGELEQIVREYGLELIGEKITIPDGEQAKSQRGPQTLQFGVYQIVEGTVQEVVISINELKSSVSSSPNLLTTQGVGYYVNCGGGENDYIFLDDNDHPLTDWRSVSPAIPSNVRDNYGIMGEGVRIAILDNVHTELKHEPSINDVDINVWSGTSWPPLPTPNCHCFSTHGAFVAGLAHAMAPQADIDLLPVLNEEGVGDLARLAHAIYAFTDQIITNPPENGAVINLSLTIEANQYTQLPANAILDPGVELLESSLENADQAGIVIVAAAGNNYDNSVPHLANLQPNIISVGANYRNEKSCFSNSGIVYAPGGGGGTISAGNPSSIDCSNDLQVDYLVNDCSLYGQNQDYCVRSWVWDATLEVPGWVIGANAGTSFSAPQVTGLVALYLQTESWDTPFNVRTAILNGATGSSYITQCATNTSSGISTPIGINPPICGIMNVQNTLGIPIGPASKN